MSVLDLVREGLHDEISRCQKTRGCASRESELRAEHELVAFSKAQYLLLDVEALSEDELAERLTYYEVGCAAWAAFNEHKEPQSGVDAAVRAALTRAFHLTDWAAPDDLKEVVLRAVKETQDEAAKQPIPGETARCPIHGSGVQPAAALKDSPTDSPTCTDASEESYIANEREQLEMERAQIIRHNGLLADGSAAKHRLKEIFATLERLDEARCRECDAPEGVHHGSDCVTGNSRKTGERVFTRPVTTADCQPVEEGDQVTAADIKRLRQISEILTGSDNRDGIWLHELSMRLDSTTHNPEEG